MVQGNTYVIGDVHGELSALRALIDNLKIKPHDKIIFLGDCVDKGPKTRETLDCLLGLSNKIQTVFIKGNHEEMMLAAIDGNKRAQHFWLKHGGQETLQSYGVKTISELDKVLPREHRAFLEQAVDAYITESHVFVHASWDTRKKPDHQTVKTLRYRFMNASYPDKKFGKTIVCGHSSLISGKPAFKGNFLCIDTVEFGWLTALDLKCGRFIQANSNGDIRRIKRAEQFSQKKHVPKQFHI